ncbi:hypothetical protein [Sporosarcina sp. NCCP-2222]|uniref:hypothetical protein n=1 Tax=Sporosarcina sp. NCCP-2222 TaxID=2935073 RepID=UPI0020BD5DA2|nr:hypothetical protein [Sporosarcina sp. NCCP-2222]
MREFVCLAFAMVYWCSPKVIGVQYELLAFTTGYWRSTRVIGVQHRLLASNSSYWRSTPVIGVQLELLAFTHFICEALVYFRERSIPTVTTRIPLPTSQFQG